jgi:hypothetical protein
MVDNGSVVDIGLRSSRAGRLFGVPFLLVGVYLGYHLVAGSLDLVTGRAALSEMLVGTSTGNGVRCRSSTASKSTC